MLVKAGEMGLDILRALFFYGIVQCNESSGT